MHRIWKYQDYVDRLNHSSKYVRRWAFSGLTEQFPGRFAPEVAQLLDDPDDRLAFEAPKYLADHGAVEFAPNLLESFLGNSKDRWGAVVRALGRLRYEPAFEAVVEKFFTSRAIEQSEFMGIVDFLGCIRSEDGKALLRRLLVEMKDLSDTAFVGATTNLAAYQDPSDLAMILDAALVRRPNRLVAESTLLGVMDAIGAKNAFEDLSASIDLNIIENPAHALDILAAHHPALRIDAHVRAKIVERLEKRRYNDLITALLFETKSILGKRYDKAEIPDYLASSYKRDLMAGAFLEQIAKKNKKWLSDPARNIALRYLISEVVTAWLSVKGRERFFEALKPGAAAAELIAAVHLSDKDLDEEIKNRLTDLAPVTELMNALRGDALSHGNNWIVKIMGDIGDHRFIPYLLSVFREVDSEAYIFDSAVSALHRFDEGGRETILTALQNDELEDPWAMLSVLEGFPYTESYDIVLSLWKNEATREEIDFPDSLSNCLMGVGDPRGVDFLLGHLTEHNILDYGRAIETLCELHDLSAPELGAVRKARAAIRKKYTIDRPNIAAVKERITIKPQAQNRRPSTKSMDHPVETKPKISKNRPCPCGSGRKYKKCCMKKK
ncbi:MAG: hypothetical protein GY859_00995 [Desulfobacterales bacterium]|nr:hypothetical protein [Desulfobacterales bacterium]